MVGKLIATLGSLLLALPALAQDQPPPYPYPGDQGGAWDPSTYPADGPYGAYPDATPDVEVEASDPGVAVSLSTFQDGLAPYGQWVTVPAYGRVWHPLRVGSAWRPYFYGRWEWTDDGWLWVSDEPFGWATYHYGRWAYEPAFGWVWVPGYRWAPAWVTWRYSPDYVGWAPLGPGFSVYASTYPAVYGWWTFVPCRSFVGVPVHSVAFTSGRVRTIYHATMAAPPRSFVNGERAAGWGGPARPFVEHRVGRAIAPVRVVPVPTPSAIRGAASAGVVPVYRPGARLAAPGRVMPAPSAPSRTVIAPAPAQHGIVTPAPAAPPRAALAPAPARPAPAQAPQGSWRVPAAPASNRPMAASPQPQHQTQPQREAQPQRATTAPAQQRFGGGAPRPQGGGQAQHGGGQVQRGGDNHGIAPVPDRH